MSVFDMRANAFAVGTGGGAAEGTGTTAEGGGAGSTGTAAESGAAADATASERNNR